MLGHNLFAYCKNNPVNKKDDNGFSCSSVFGEGGEGNYQTNNGGTSRKSVLEGSVPAGFDKTTSEIAIQQNTTTPYEIFRTMEGNRATRRAYIRPITKLERYTEFLPNTFKGNATKFHSKYGIAGTVLFGSSLISDFASNNIENAAILAAIDIFAFGMGIFMVGLIPAATPLAMAYLGGVMVGFITSYGAELGKNAYITNSKK